jgi:SAM-dependent methyltransferase
MGPISEYLYHGQGYLERNPDWGAADAVWKAGQIEGLIRELHLVPAEITEIGCGSGKILEELARTFPDISSFRGYDISPDAIRLAEQKKSGRVLFFKSDLAADPDYHTDLLLVIDVVEHVEDYYGFLASLHNKADYFIFHIPLDLSVRTLLKSHVLLQQRESVGHIHYFSRDMVFWMLKDTGFEIKDWKYTKPVTDRQKPAGLKMMINKFLRNFSFTLHKDLSSDLWGNYSLLIAAQPKK